MTVRTRQPAVVQRPPGAEEDPTAELFPATAPARSAGSNGSGPALLGPLPAPRQAAESGWVTEVGEVAEVASADSVPVPRGSLPAPRQAAAESGESGEVGEVGVAQPGDEGADVLEELEGHLSAARAAHGRERSAHLRAWRARLRTPPVGPGSRQALAHWLMELLQEGTLEALVGEERWTARAMAAEALLSLGYPHALEIHPDDLEHLRAVQALRPGGSGLLATIALMACLLAIGGDALDGQLELLALAGGLLAPVMPGVVIWNRFRKSPRAPRNVRGVDYKPRIRY